MALVNQRQQDEAVECLSVDSVLLAPVQPALFQQFYAEDPFYQQSTEKLSKHKVCKINNLYWHQVNDVKRLCVPLQLIQHVLHYCHDDPFSGHLGYHKTYQLASRKYWWPTIRKDVAAYCKQCVNCQTFKVGPAYKHPLTRLPIPDGPFESVSLDFITSLPMTTAGHDSLLVVVDRFSKFTTLIPTTTTVTAQQVAQLLLQHIVPHYGVPRNFVSDRDPKFCSEFFAEWCELLSVRQVDITLKQMDKLSA